LGAADFDRHKSLNTGKIFWSGSGANTTSGRDDLPEHHLRGHVEPTKPEVDRFEFAIENGAPRPMKMAILFRDSPPALSRCVTGGGFPDAMKRLLRFMDGYQTLPGIGSTSAPGAGPEVEGKTPKRREGDMRLGCVITDRVAQ